MAPIEIVVPNEDWLQFVWYIGDETENAREDASLIIPTEEQVEQELSEWRERKINPNYSYQTPITRNGNVICLKLELQGHTMHIPWSMVNRDRIEFSDKRYDYILSAKSGPKGCFTIEKDVWRSDEYERWTLYNFETKKNPDIVVKSESGKVLLPLKRWSKFLVPVVETYDE